MNSIEEKDIKFLISQNDELKKQNENLQTENRILRGALEQIADGEGNTCHGIIAKQALEKAKK